ncbi:ATP-grasp domain-containing protein [Mucilaginibacter sp. FT3.2]|uniref:ATP-grasp domain-containing protein n=1 Tax=Mucilaginibacter sp. FT3.2 TaxID=2723090 RepID=UPI0016078867|nr:hypothetical protein [Mucilaginibacter sp. FT3.2]MBB6234235.1 glutathione synthase/RimK-type ligase-like ATP-grasp enzyme [Mucilaginibacter sp. FT3.2]
MHICFVTYNKEINLTTDDRAAAAWLQAAGIAVTAVCWEDEGVSWNSFDAVIIRSTWNYYLRIREFNEWLNKLIQLDCLVLNPVSVIRLNQNKKYLADFFETGKNIPAFKYFAKNSSADISKTLLENHWDKAVIKPAVSGGAYNTWIASESTAVSDSARLNELLKNGEYIVQKFVNEILTEGEISLIFFNKFFSHAILKKPKTGDFRVQTDYGGTSVDFYPGKKIIADAAAFLLHIREPLLYARVDGVIINNDFYLMELELIEPALFFTKNNNAPQNFYRAIVALLKADAAI